MNLVENLKQSLSEIELDYVAFLKAAGVTVIGFSIIYCG